MLCDDSFYVLFCVVEYEVVSGLLKLCVVFFFQAEDGIRDLVRSRGLGDVYKRQVSTPMPNTMSGSSSSGVKPARSSMWAKLAFASRAVSYTHLTLPTSDLV